MMMMASQPMVHKKVIVEKKIIRKHGRYEEKVAADKQTTGKGE